MFIHAGRRIHCKGECPMGFDKTDPPLLITRQTSSDIVSFLKECGTLFRVFDKQDSGCISYGVRDDAGAHVFVKYSEQLRAASYLKQAERFYSEVSHPTIPKLLNSFQTDRGYALVFEWVEGEVLGSPDFPGKEGRNRPDSPHYRFRQLPTERIVQGLNSIYDTHTAIERNGYVAVDFYDGCMIYDFKRHELRLCDFDHYSKGAYVLEMDRNYGSSRFMAPEEFVRGSLIDQRTNVFTMGAAAFVFLADGSRHLDDWRGSETQYEVALKATSPQREDRYDNVKSFYAAWNEAAEST